MSKMTAEKRARVVELMDQLDQAAMQRFLAYLQWVVDDGRSETNPMRDDPAFQEFKLRRADERGAS